MKFFWACIFRLPLVWLIDIDGQANLRWAHVTSLHDVWVRRQPYGIRNVFLEAGGVVRNGSYVRSWKPANRIGAKLFTKETV